ncbi:hypothetical protein [Enterovibrio coralii]|uniref:Uncharacterized protein n=1 Tax=Enterovibrio coralii TaxID=294935 RepID=A0A135ICY8_9GAMM|nr:hypothetical protein [Enterovibrio coralii]KXF83275.1 hypothetical protein ATN88_06230 [Enterovibrio coralii]
MGFLGFFIGGALGAIAGPVWMFTGGIIGGILFSTLSAGAKRETEDLVGDVQFSRSSERGCMRHHLRKRRKERRDSDLEDLDIGLIVGTTAGIATADTMLGETTSDTDKVLEPNLRFAFDDDDVFGDTLLSDDNDLLDELKDTDLDINPATGLPIVSGIGSVDVGGNPYGIDLSDNDIGSMTDDLEQQMSSLAEELQESGIEERFWSSDDDDISLTDDDFGSVDDDKW